MSILITEKRRQRAVQKLREVSGRTTLDIDPVAFARSLRGESDRGTIILAATMVDDRLRHQLEEVLGPRPSAKVSGRLDRSFASRLELAVEVGLVAPATAEMVDIIREMRNACAHGRDNLTFRSPAIVEALKSLLTEDSAGGLPSNASLRRDLYVVICGALAATLSGGLSKESYKLLEPVFKQATGTVPTWISHR